MSRYIDADELIKHFNCEGAVMVFGGAINAVISRINVTPTADVVPRAELEHTLSDLKKEIHDKAVYPEARSVKPYISLKVVDAIINNTMEEVRTEK